MFTQGDLSENFNLWIRYREVKLTWIQQCPPVEISALKVRDILYAFCNFSPPDCIKVKDDFFSSISKPELTISWWELSKSINFFPTIIYTIFFSTYFLASNSVLNAFENSTYRWLRLDQLVRPLDKMTMFLFVRIRLLNLNIMKPMEAENVQDESLHNFATLNLEFIFFSVRKKKWWNFDK